MKQQQTERDEALIADVDFLRDIGFNGPRHGGMPSVTCNRLLQIAERFDALLRGDEPAKPVDDEEPMVPRDVAESWKARADNLKEDRENLLSDLAIMMSKHVENWPEPKRFSTAIALLDKILSEALGKSLPEPAKPDRYVVAAREALAGAERGIADEIMSGGMDEKPWLQAAAAVLRKHFEPSAEVVEAAKSRSADHPLSAPGIMRDHILKGGA